MLQVRRVSLKPIGVLMGCAVVAASCDMVEPTLEPCTVCRAIAAATSKACAVGAATVGRALGHHREGLLVVASSSPPLLVMHTGRVPCVVGTRVL